MILDFPSLTLVHVILSVVGILAGLVVTGGMMAGVRFDGWIGIFLATTILTNATGFLFPFTMILPSHILGGLSLIILPVAVFARYARRLDGGWRSVFVITSVTALYFNVFVLIVQLFQKFPGLIVIAPSQQAPAFIATQLLMLVVFVVLGRAALRGFRGAPAP